MLAELELAFFWVAFLLVGVVTVGPAATKAHLAGASGDRGGPGTPEYTHLQFTPLKVAQTPLILPSSGSSLQPQFELSKTLYRFLLLTLACICRATHAHSQVTGIVLIDSQKYGIIWQNRAKYRPVVLTHPHFRCINILSMVRQWFENC